MHDGPPSLVPSLTMESGTLELSVSELELCRYIVKWIVVMGKLFYRILKLSAYILLPFCS